METEERIEALAKYLECDPKEIAESRYDDTRLEWGREEWLVLTDEEADALARERIEGALWAFNTEFLRAHSKALRSDGAVKAIRKAQEDLCEGANDLVRALIDDFDHFVADAIRADGRGHFLAGYDFEEIETRVDGQTVYLYREN